MLAVFQLAAALGLSATHFKAAFPAATTIESPAGGRLTNAFGFEVAGLGDTPETAARAFLAKYGAAFGVSRRQALVVRAARVAGRPGPVRFERRLYNLPIFDGDVVVGVNARNAVILVNGTDVPTQVKGRFRISRKAAIRASKDAIRGLEMSDAPRTERGWRGAGRAIRPVWRVEFTAARPPGDWRTYVDAETGNVLLRVDLRADAAGSGFVPERGLLERPAPRR